MKWFSKNRAEQRHDPAEKEAAIRLYRRYAANAIADERWQVAEVFFNRIIEISPLHSEAWLMKGWLRQHCENDEATALECYQKVLVLCGHDPAHPHVQRAKHSLGRIVAAAL